MGDTKQGDIPTAIHMGTSRFNVVNNDVVSMYIPI